MGLHAYMILICGCYSNEDELQFLDELFL